MKVLVLGFITATFLSGVAAITVRIRAYSATGELDIPRDPFTLGTRVLLICDATEVAPGSEVASCRWFQNCTGGSRGRCEIQNRHPYYRVANDTLLVDVTSWDQGGRYTCFVSFSNAPQSSGSTDIITVKGSPALFLYTPTSLLPEHSVITDVQQATGRNRQQWITCRSGGQTIKPKIWFGHNELNLTSSTSTSATIGLGNHSLNGLYHCLSSQSQREFFSLFFRNSVNLPTPTVSACNPTMWTLTPPDGCRVLVERYIVEFECRLRNITFVEKYMSVGVSKGTGRVATSVSCFGGLGQLYRVKAWAVSGPNISRALVCTPDKPCREEGYTPTASCLPTTSPESTPIPTTVTNLERPDIIPYPPLVVAAISAANTLLLLVSLVTFFASCAVLRRAKRNRRKHTAALHYTATDGRIVNVDSDTVPVSTDADDITLPVQLQYQTLQSHTLHDHQYATVTGHTSH